MAAPLILHPSSFILHPSSFILHPSSFIQPAPWRQSCIARAEGMRFAACGLLVDPTDRRRE
jgi:hypothetical protein